MTATVFASGLHAQTSAPPGIGFIGLGARSKAHFAALKQLPEAKVVALCDIDSSRIRETNAGLPAKAVGYTDYRELLHDKNVGVVVIATPNYLHYEMAIAALRAGKDLLLEKPMGINWQQAKEIREEAIRNGRVLAIGIQRLYGSDGVMIDIVQRGEIGNVKVINASEYRGDWNLKGDETCSGLFGIGVFGSLICRALQDYQLSACPLDGDGRRFLLSKPGDAGCILDDCRIPESYTSQPQLCYVFSLFDSCQYFRISGKSKPSKRQYHALR